MGLGAEMTEVPKVPQPDPPGVASFIHRTTVRSVQALTSLSLLEPESANDGWWKPKSCNHHGSPGCLGLDPGQGPAALSSGSHDRVPTSENRGSQCLGDQRESDRA